MHDFDVTRWLLGEELAAIRVIAAKPNSHGGELQDPLLMILESESGVLVNVETSVNIRYGYDIRGEVVGETGTAALADRGRVVVRSADQVGRRGARGLARALHRRLRRRAPGVDQRGDRRQGADRAQRLGRLRRAGRLRRRGQGAVQRRAGRDRPRRQARPLQLTPARRPEGRMKIALDPYMFRTTPLLELPGVVADLGYEYIELSPREDFTPFFLHPRIDDAG